MDAAFQAREEELVQLEAKLPKREARLEHQLGVVPDPCDAASLPLRVFVGSKVFYTSK